MTNETNGPTNQWCIDLAGVEVSDAAFKVRFGIRVLRSIVTRAEKERLETDAKLKKDFNNGVTWAGRCIELEFMKENVQSILENHIIDREDHGLKNLIDLASNKRKALEGMLINNYFKPMSSSPLANAVRMHQAEAACELIRELSSFVRSVQEAQES